MLEREIRFKINEDVKKSIINSSTLLEENSRCVDLCMGKYGFDSLDKLGYIIRLRDKKGKIILESKRLIENNKWMEYSIPLEDMKTGYNFLSNLGLKPYLYINREREVRKITGATICIDKVDLLGDYVEFELEDGFEFEDIEQYIKQNNIQGEPAKLYGDIFKDNMESPEFKKEFEKALNDFLINPNVRNREETENVER